MNIHEFDRAKYSLLRELDARFQRYYHERLSEVINDLRLHHAEIKPDPNLDELISVIDKNRILDFVSAPPMKDLRETFDRLKRGTFGLCVDCGNKLAPELLEKQPTMKLCDGCSNRKV
jgi:RNA polymerase-binding transcription factor DksA